MPIYEYRCESCGHTLDALQKIADAPLSDCPSCDESSLKRLISAPVFRLKGKGWYETDFKSDKETKRNLAGHGDGEAKPDKSADAKMDGKADGKPGAGGDKSAPGGDKSASGGGKPSANGGSARSPGKAAKPSPGARSGTEAA